MFKKVLSCNRGEIALRIIRTCRDMGIKTVQVYSKADADSRPVELADEAVLIGPPAAARSYLHIPSIIHACMMTGAEAVHPGYGFLFDNPHLRDEVRCGLRATGRAIVRAHRGCGSATALCGSAWTSWITRNA